MQDLTVDGLKNQDWFAYLDHGMADLVLQAVVILRQEESHRSHRFHDYSFVVFAGAKAYEGFVKKWLFENGLIDEGELNGKHFRVGKSLNPDLPKRFRNDDWLYDDLSGFCQRNNHQDLPEQMWQTWRQARNTIFHYYFPDHSHFIKLPEAREKLSMIVKSMKHAVECGVEGSNLNMNVETRNKS